MAGGVLGLRLRTSCLARQYFRSRPQLRAEPALWFAEVVATFGLVLTIFGTLRWKPEAIPFTVGLYIVAAYWFTASTSFANPAVTLARALSDTFAGIAPTDVSAFVLAQFAGALAATAFALVFFSVTAR